ncbi:MAG: AAA family ATPase [Bdellovibrionia bacterium]
MSVRVAKQVKQGVVLALIISSLGLGLNPLWITPARAMNPVSATEDAENQKLVDAIKKITDELRATLPQNSFGVALPKIQHPHEVTSAIDRLETILHSAQGKAFNRPEEARLTVLTALELLYKGRGATNRGDGTGWYLANRTGDTGLYEIREILNRGLLDTQGKQQFAEFVQKYDHTDPSTKTKVGFPPQFNLIDDSLKSAVATDTLRAPAGPAFTARPPALTATGQIAAEKHKTVRELLDEQVKAGKVSGDDANDLMKFVNSAESNHYDKSVTTHNDPNKSFIKYFGREVESQEMIDALTRVEKGHVLLTGKAGVGKTTILKLLSDKFVQGTQGIHDEKPPIILELPITTVTNPSDPSAPKNVVANAKALSKALDRRVILYVDEAHISTAMTRNALKGYLTEMQHGLGDDPKVNMIFSTTSAEARDFFKDSAFSRRFSEIHVPEFGRDDTIKLIKQSNVPLWQKAHKKNGASFSSIDDDAFDYAYRFAASEQPHAGNPTGTKELLEGALSRKLNALATQGRKGDFNLTADDVREYIASKLKTPLIPGDPKFNDNFNKQWTDFREDYGGNDGAMTEMKQILKDHFGSSHKGKMTAVVAFGPPGGGKSYGAESVAKHFFNNAMLTINGAEFKNGGLELNKLIGSPVGTVGSEQQRSILTKFIQEHPAGGVIKIEEADYLHHDVVQLLTNMITDKKFTDGLGKEYDASKFVIWQNTNIGQDLMIPTNAANKMTWEQYNTRRANLTETILIDGKPVERVKPDQMSALFDRYVGEIVEKSNPGGDTSSIAQEANKQKRRYKGIYILPPNKEEVMEAAQRKAKKFIKDAKLDYGVNFEISPEAVNKALNIDHYQFEKGYSYAEEQLQEKIFSKLTPYFGDRGKTFKAHIEDTHIEYDGRQLPAQNLIVDSSDGKSEKFALGALINEEKNPWGSNPVTMKRIDNFQEEMSKHVKGNQDVLADMASVLKSKSVDWNDKAVFTLLGTSGNGKTETFKAMAKVLYGDEKAMFKITGVDHPWDLSDYLRPPTGISGSNKETDFERWFKSRKSAGGGIILFDELMSEIGKSSGTSVEGQKGGKIAVLQELYELLDEQKLKINGKYEDARGFVVGITGNSLQEMFSGLDDNPETESLVKKIREKLTRSEIVQNLERQGLDAPKIARLGHIYVMGPQPREVSLGVGGIKIKKAIDEIRKAANNPNLEIIIPENATESVVNRLSTVKLGMREVDEGFNAMMFRPLKTMMADIQRIKGHRIQKIEMKIPDGEHPQWFVDGEEVILEGKKLPGGGEKRTWEFKKHASADGINRTPSVHDLKSVEKMKYTPELLHEVAVHEVYGHWMTNAMLNRQNGADFVSLIPGPGYLGYVRPKAQEVADVQNLSSVLKRMVELSAGHRAVFYHGSYATGGGNDGSARGAGKEAADDLGKIEKLKNMLINNGLFPGVREGSSAQEKAIASEIIDKVVDSMADEVIHKGIESKEFEPVFNKVMKDRYLTKEDLDALIKKVDYDKFGYKGKDGLFMETLSASIAKELDALKGTPHFEQAKKLSSGLLARTFDESMTRAKGNPAATAELDEIKSAVVSKVKEGTAHPRMELKCIKRHIEESLF